MKTENSKNMENEPRRLSSLHQYHILEPDADISYDDITILASQICQTPIALVTLIDEDKAWFKSAIGLSLIYTDRNDVFCNHTIAQNDVFVVEDLKNSIFAENVYVAKEQGIRFYAGAPLIDKEGYALGTLCVMDYKPRTLNGEQITALRALSRQVIKLLELKIAKEKFDKNISELQRLSRLNAEQQAKMVQAARMTSLGEMADGMAHEVNNPLSVIDHAVEKMNRAHRYDGGAIFMIQKAINRINKIITGLRFMALEGSKEPKEKLNVKCVLDIVKELYSSRAKEEGIQLTLESDDRHMIEARQCHLTQVLMHLMQNSFQAVKKVDKKAIKLSSRLEGNQVVIEICDTGPGISPKLKHKIFEPFFTTKIGGEGTGLGLSVSKKLAEYNGGFLEYVPSEHGTKFAVKFRQNYLH